MTRHLHLGVLTAGGDAPGLNAAVRAVVKSAILTYGWSITGFLDGYEGVLTGRSCTLTLDSVRGWLPLGGTRLGTSNRTNPFWCVLPESGDLEPRDHSWMFIQALERHGIDALIVIGGDGSLSIAYRLWQLGVPVVGVPKTIDNDVRGTDVTIGFDTAVTVATDAIDRLHTTAESHHRVMVLELMGRTAGWIALYAGIAGGADVVLIPEIPYCLETVVDVIRYREQAGRAFTIVAVAEGARPRDGEAVYEVTGPQPYQRKYGGIGHVLREQLAREVSREVRAMALSYLQRGGTPTARDRALATMLGTAAVDAVAARVFGSMVALRDDPLGRAARGVVTVPLAEPARGPRHVPVEHPLVESARRLGISLGDAPGQRV